MEDLLLKNAIRNVPNFPKKGINFKDITTLLKDPRCFHRVIDIFGDRYRTYKVDQVVAVEARGFILGAAIAYKLGAGFIPIRKPGKLPAKTLKVEYLLEYGKDAVEIHEDAIIPGQKILIFDDVLATGGTILATAELVKRLGGNIVELAFLIELSFLNAREKLKQYPIFSIIQFDEK